MKEGVSKVLALLHIVSLLNMKRLDAPDVICFCSSSVGDVYCSIGMDCSDGEWASSRGVHFWLTAAFICIEDDEDLISG